MARKIKGNMSDFHERVMMAMFLATWRYDSQPASYEYLQGRGIAHLLGGAWSTYRHNQMLELEKLGGVKCLKKNNGRGQWFYALTEKGINRVESMIENARLGSFKLSKSKSEKALESQRSLFNLGENENGE